MQSNMLSAKKTKIHGMKSSRWNVDDKITQYKGLVNLYARDKKILEFDTAVSRKKLKKEIRKLRYKIDDQRHELDNAICGDRQRLRNTLSDYRNLQLAYQNMHPKKVIDVLYQENFNKRKELDRVAYIMNQKREKLIGLKLQHAELEDRLKYEQVSQIPEEEQAQIITVKVQDAILKNEAAADVRKTYFRILNLLGKDAIYFDAVLAALKMDGYNQGKCLLKVTEMGQLATEYLDDRKDEYRQLEKVLKKSMKERAESLQDIQDQLDFLHNNVKYLIRRDSVIELDGEKKSKHTYSETTLISSIENIRKTLNSLKETTVVAKIEDIFPRMEEQLRQKLRLEELIKKNTKDRDRLMNKSKHAEEMYNNLAHTMVSTTMWYKEQKARINGELDEKTNKIEETWNVIKIRGDIYIRIRSSLQQLAEILRNVSTPQAQAASRGRDVRKKVTHVEEPKVVKPEIVEADAMKLITLVTQKLNILVNNAAGQDMDAARKETATSQFQKFVTNMTVCDSIFAEGPKEESLLGDLQFDDPCVPSRQEIKARSAEICAKNAKTEFDVD